MIKKQVATIVLGLAILTSWGCGGEKQTVPESTTPPPSLAEPDGQVMVVTANLLNLRDCPGNTCQIIAVLPRSQEVVKLGAESRWLRVRVPAIQKEGWVAARYVAAKRTKPPASPAPLPPPTPKMKKDWSVPAVQEEPQVEEGAAAPKDHAGPKVKEEWAMPETQEASEVKKEGAASEEQTPPEIEEEFAK